MKILKDFRLKWWQTGLFKSAVMSIGILLGVYFSDFLRNYLTVFWIIAIVATIYIAYVWYKE